MTTKNIFISYSHEDEDYKNKLEKHLSVLKRSQIINTWHDRKILPGEEWDKKIKHELENSDIILLLVSVDFLNSDYCYDIEIERAIEKHNTGDAVVIPIILRKCDWKQTKFSKLQALPENAAPIKSFSDEDEAFYGIISGIKKSIEKLNKKIEQGKILQDHLKNKNTFSISHTIKSECDVPPNIPYWVGRTQEIQEIDEDLHKVVFISGIGGQGKSGLASYFIKDAVQRKNNWEYWDWRDCQEKENRIHTKIISIIARLTKGSILPNQLIDATIDDLIELFFQELSNREIIFVFDNIDAYIEFEHFQLTGALDKLYKNALRRNHNSKFIFTCRSSINDIDPNLLIIKLQGLNFDETKMLFQEYKLSLKKHEEIKLAEKSFDLTNGHLLWLNLIAAQARKGLSFVEKFLIDIRAQTSFKEDSMSSILSNKILNVIWDSLNDKQRTLLMGFAEIVRSETENNLRKILSSEINHNQFTKAFKTLKQLNLLVIKSRQDEHDTFELHPLVKEFIRQNYSRTERSHFISLFVNFYDNVILVLKPRLNADQPLNFFEHWTVKVELAINNDDYKTALITLEEVSVSICNAGYIEEYIRVSNLLFINIDWKTAIVEEYSYFNTQFSLYINKLTEFGKFDESTAYLTKYKKHISNKGINYIRYCKSMSHLLWFQEDYSSAIEIAEEALLLENQSTIKNDLDVENALALALRDSKDIKNIAKALTIFLKEHDLQTLLLKDDYVSGEIYGNVGRCLQYSDDISNAIKCYKRSLKKLDDPMNKGYAFHWYAECLISQNQIDIAVWFFKQAENIWKKHSPIKAKQVYKKIEAIIEVNPTLYNIIEKNEDEVEKYCLRILK